MKMTLELRLGSAATLSAEDLDLETGSRGILFDKSHLAQSQCQEKRPTSDIIFGRLIYELVLYRRLRFEFAFR